MSTNGLTSTPGLFYTGDVDSNIYLRSGEAIVDPVFEPAITIEDGQGNTSVIGFQPDVGSAAAEDLTLYAENGSVNLYSETGVVNVGIVAGINSNTASIAVEESNRMTLTAYNSILFVPNALSGAATEGVILQDGVESPAITAPTYNFAPNPATAVIKDQAMRTFQSLSNASTAPDTTFIGKSTYLINVATITLPGAGSVPAGAEMVFYVAPGSTTLFKTASNNLITVGPTASQIAQVTCFTPDQGTTWAVVDVVYSIAAS